MAEVIVTSPGNILTDAIYKSSFGDIPDGFVYQDYFLDVDRRPELAQVMQDEFEKALSLGGTGQYLVPVYLDPDIIRLTRERFPFLDRLRKVTNRGKTADYNRLTALGAAYSAAEDAALSEVDDTYERKSKAIAYHYSIGRVTGPVMAASREYVDAQALEARNKTLALQFLREKLALRGSTTGADDAEIYEVQLEGYNGLLKEIVTNVTDRTGTAMDDLDIVRTAIRQCYEGGGEGAQNLLGVTDQKTLDTLKGLMSSVISYLGPQNVRQIEYGIQGINFEGTPIIVLRSMPTATNKRVLMFVDMNVTELRVLQDVVMEPLAKANDSNKFMVKDYECLVLKNEAWCSKIINNP